MHHRVQRKKRKEEEQGEARKSSQGDAEHYEATKVVPKGAQRKFSAQKSFLRERSISFLLKSCSKWNAEPNTAEIEGEKVQNSFLRGM